MIRLQKYMADSGVASRRNSEKMILEGRVSVNGEIITEMGHKVSNDDVIMVDGKRIDAVTEKKYFVMNKPRGVVSTVNDPRGRKTIIDILPEELKEFRLFPVGRLDYDTKGVLLLTNDGNFMNMLVGPTSHTEKEYLVRVKGIVKKEDLIKLSRGVKINDEKNEYVSRPCKAYINQIDKINNSTSVGLIIEEGKYHQVKNMMKAIGYQPLRLSRIRFGRITLEGLAEGNIRELSIHEVKTLIGDSMAKKDYSYHKVRNI